MQEGRQNMNRKLKNKLNAYKTVLNGMTGLDNRKRWTERVLADVEKSALAGSEKAVLAREIIKVYEA